VTHPGRAAHGSRRRPVRASGLVGCAAPRANGAVTCGHQWPGPRTPDSPAGRRDHGAC